MRKEQARERESKDREAQELSRFVGPDGAEGAPKFNSENAGLKSSAARTERPTQENAPGASESAEQSKNVVENKGPAEEEVNA